MEGIRNIGVKEKKLVELAQLLRESYLKVSTKLNRAQ